MRTPVPDAVQPTPPPDPGPLPSPPDPSPRPDPAPGPPTSHPTWPAAALLSLPDRPQGDPMPPRVSGEHGESHPIGREVVATDPPRVPFPQGV